MDQPPEPDEKKHRPLSTYVGCFGVMAVIVVFIGMLLPGHGPREASYKIMARDDERHIIDAIKAYYAEYGTFPVDPKASGVVVFSTNNNLLFDALRDCTGEKPGNALNPRDLAILEVPPATNQSHPKSGLQTSTGIWFDPWGSPYHIAIDAGRRGEINEKASIPDFYSDVGTIQGLDVVVWSCGKNGKIGGGPATKSGFTDETGTPGKLAGSEDVVSWK